MQNREESFDSWRKRLEEAGWEEQDNGSWILPDEYEWGMRFEQAIRVQMRKEQWGA